MSIAQMMQCVGATQVTWPQMQVVTPAEPALDGEWVIQARVMNPNSSAKLTLCDTLLAELHKCLNKSPTIAFLIIALGKLNEDGVLVVTIKDGPDKAELERQCAAANKWSMQENPPFMFQVVQRISPLPH